MLNTGFRHFSNDPAPTPTLCVNPWASNLPSEPHFTHLENEANKKIIVLPSEGYWENDMR